ncbi:MAG: peptidylprolyl isomerase [Chloroflexi bacterium]|nr:peptidylprolyl isomerase [Chloroflexota bacterium]
MRSGGASRAALIGWLALLLVVVAGPSMAQDRPSVPTGPPAATPLASPPAVPAGDGTAIRFTTDLGDILIGVYTESSPVAAANFVALAASGYYDGTPFHRVVPGFVIQGGSPDGTGTGNPGYTIRDEPIVGTYGRGIVAMARPPGPDSQGSQFFIVLDDDARVPLDAVRTYAIIGRVLEGMDVVDAVASRPNAPGGDSPVDPVRIVSTAMETATMPVEVAPTPTPRPDDPELAARVPVTVGGVTLRTVSVSGWGLVSEFGADDPLLVELRELAETRGATLEELSLVVAGANLTSGELLDVTGFRLPGGVLADAVVDLAHIVTGTTTLTATPTTVAGRDAYSVTGLALDVPITGLVTGDIVWLIRTADVAARDELLLALAAD